MRAINLADLDETEKGAILDVAQGNEPTVPSPLQGIAKYLLENGYADEKPTGWNTSVMVPTKKLMDECSMWIRQNESQTDYSGLV